MTGQIAITSLKGGRIVTDTGEAFHFAWCDCGGDVKPNNVGHSTRVEFHVQVVGAVAKAIGVRRARESCPKGYC